MIQVINAKSKTDNAVPGEHLQSAEDHPSGGAEQQSALDEML